MPVLLNDHIAAGGEEIALTDDTGALGWRALGERVNRWSDLLTGRGLGPGDHVACTMGNRRETIELLLACLHTGITLVPVNWHLTASEIAHILADSGSRALVTEEAHARSAVHAAGPVEVLVAGDRDVPGGTAVEPLLRRARAAEPERQTCGAVMFYTSGTTGRPKGVVNGMFQVGAPFSRVHRLTRYANAVLDVPAGERVLLDGPWYHSAQLFFALLAHLQGSRLVMRGRFDPAATLEVIDRERITAVHLVPTQFVRLLRLEDAKRGGFDGSSLRRVWHGGGPCPPGVKRQMIDWWGPVLLEYYGATEAGAVTLIDSRAWLRRPGSVGRAIPPGEILIVDDGGQPLPPGRTGRVFIRRQGRGFHYRNAPDKTRSAYLNPDTFTYGEVGRLDADGYLYLTGRAQDMIVTGGVNVYPAEVEAVLLAHPAVRDAAVVAVPDEEYGERVAAVVEAGPGAPDDLPALLDRHCRRSLAGFKTPRAYHLVDALPREPTGKLRKEAMSAWFETASEPASQTAIEVSEEGRR